MSTDLDVERKSRHEREDDVPVVAAEEPTEPGARRPSHGGMVTRPGDAYRAGAVQRV